MTNMTNEALKAFIDEMGDRCFLLCTDNGHKFFFGAPHGQEAAIYASQIQYKTVGGVDMFGVSRVDRTWQGIGVPYTTWAVTSYIQFICVVDPDEEGNITEYLPDLNKWF